MFVLAYFGASFFFFALYLAGVVEYLVKYAPRQPFFDGVRVHSTTQLRSWAVAVRVGPADMLAPSAVSGSPCHCFPLVKGHELKEALPRLQWNIVSALLGGWYSLHYESCQLMVCEPSALVT